MITVSVPDTREKLEQVIRVLDEVVEHNKRFNMGVWVSKWSCGTTACAIGYAAQDDWFIDRGFYLEADTMSGTSKPAYFDFRDFGAVTEFFAIDLYQANYLFLGTCYKGGYDLTAEVVKERINNVLKRGFPERMYNEQN